MKLNHLWNYFGRQSKPMTPTKDSQDSGDAIVRKQTISLKHLAVAFLPLAFCLLPLATPTNAAKNKYNDCAASLVNLNLNPQAVAKSCSQSLYPENLASCVVDIAEETDTLAEDALNTCTQVRRPLELATCVVDISDVGTASDVSDILDHCSRSLLPVNFSQCVLGLVNQTDFGTAEALRYCIDGSDRGRNSNLTWVPTDKGRFSH